MREEDSWRSPGRRWLVWSLIGLGLVAVVSRFAPDTGWLWVALAAAGFLVAYRSQETYAFLVVGGILTGIAAGLLVEGGWQLPGFFLICLGTGFLVVDQVEPRPTRWPVYPGSLLIALGLLQWLFSSAVVAFLWLPILLIAAGIILLLRRAGKDWVHLPDPPEQDAPDAMEQDRPKH